MEEFELPVRKSEKAAIVIRDAYKRYTKTKIILNGFNLTVPEGSM